MPKKIPVGKTSSLLLHFFFFTKMPNFTYGGSPPAQQVYHLQWCHKGISSVGGKVWVLSIQCGCCTQADCPEAAIPCQRVALLWVAGVPLLWVRWCGLTQRPVPLHQQSSQHWGKQTYSLSCGLPAGEGDEYPLPLWSFVWLLGCHRKQQ